MAFQYFLYNTLFNNTLVERSNNSFAPLPPNTGEIYIDYFIPEIQPLYYYRESGSTIVLNSEENINAYLEGTASPPTPEENVPYYEYTASTESTNARIDDLVQSLSGVSTGTTVDAISFHADATANIALSNQVIGIQFLANNNRNIRRIDLSNAIQIRLLARVTTSSVSVNNPRLLLRYFNAFSTNTGDYLDIGASEVSASLSSVGVSTSGWIDIVPAAKGDVFLAMFQIGGDGAADPQTGNIVVEIRKLIKTAESSVSGITEQIFTGYTASTNTRLVGIENDINYLSGQTDTKLNVSDFNTYSGNTDNRLNDIEDDIVYISGITDTKLDIIDFNSYTGATSTEISNKLNTSIFNSFTGTTLPNNYYNKTEINSYTGITAGQINLKLNISDYNLYTGNTDNKLINIESDISYLSGQTANKLNTSVFNSYTGNTDTRLGGIEDDIIYISGITDTKLNISDFNTYTGNSTTEFTGYTATTNTRLNGIEDDINYLSGITDTKLNTEVFTGYTANTQTDFFSYTATTEPKLWGIFQPLDGVTPDDQRFEEYADKQLFNGQPIFLHDPTDLGFVFTGLTTTKSYNKLPWIGVNGGLSAPRLKLNGGSVFSTSGIRGVEFYIEVNSHVELMGLSEHSRVDLSEIRFAIGGTGNSLTLRAVNMTVGRIEGQTGVSDLYIKDRSNIQAQNLNEIENVYIEGGSILTANWIRINTMLNVGYNGVTKSTDGTIVTLAKPNNLTTGKIKIYGDNNILIASGFPVDILSGATNNAIIGLDNTISDSGTSTVILQNLSGGTSISWGDIAGTLSNQTDLWSILTGKTDNSAFNTFTGTTVPANYYNKTEINNYSGATQTLIGTKQNTITGAATTITTSNLTASRALVSDASGKVAVSTVTSTELGYLAGTTSAIQTQLGTKANLASPALTGTPTAPTAAVDTNTTQIATTAYVVGQAANVNPLMDGSVAVGTSLRYARQDHVHPVDTSRFAVAGGTITGSVTINTNLTVSGVATLGNVTPDVNQQNFTVIDNTTKKVANSGTKFHVYGSEFQYAESLAESTTTSTTPQIKVTLTTTDLPAGLYKLTGVARGRANTTNSDMIFRLYQGASALGTTDINIEPKDGTSYYPIVMTHFLNLSGVQTFTFRYSSETNGVTIYISDATLELIRVQ